MRDNRRLGQEDTVGNGVFWLYMYFLVDFFLHLSARIPGYGSIRPTLLLVGLITLCLFAQKDRFKAQAQDPIIRAFIAMAIYLVISLPLVEWPGSVIKKNLPVFVKGIVFLFFTAYLIDTPKRLKTFLYVFIGCQIIRILEPLYLNITQGYWGSSTHMGGGEYASRLAGAPSDVINPNELGFVIVTVIPYLYYFLFLGRMKSKIMFFMLMGPLFYALVLTSSRGALIALAVVAAAIFRESSNKTLLAVAFAALAVVGFSQLDSSQKDRYLSLFGGSESQNAKTVDGRIAGMKKEFELGFERPIVGHGVGTTPEAKYHKWGKTQASHNMYGELLIEIGIIGAFFFLRFMHKIYRRLKELRESLNNLSDDSMLWKLNKSLIVIFWMYAVYSINYWGLSQYYWYLLAGLVVACHRILSKEKQVDDTLQKVK